MAELYNLAKETTSGTGQVGTITLTGAVTGYNTFAGAGVQNGDVVSYGIWDTSASEVGRGVYASAGTTLTRGTVISSTSGAGTAINLSGSAEVFITALAEDINKDIGCRVYNDSAIVTSNNTMTALTFNQERWDTDTMHDTSTNPGHLIAKTAGKYIISGNIKYGGNATGARGLHIRLDGTTFIATSTLPVSAVLDTYMNVSIVYNMAVNQYAELMALQTTGTDLTIAAETQYSPEFMMQLIAEVG